MSKQPLSSSEALFKTADFLRDISVMLDASISQPVLAVEAAARNVEKSWSGSWLGYQANVYYEAFRRPPTGARFSQEWGFRKNYSSEATTGEWIEFDPVYVEQEIYRMAGNRDMKPFRRIADKAAKDFDESKIQILSILERELAGSYDSYLETLKNSVEKLVLLSVNSLITSITPNRTIISRDNVALEQGLRTPPHIKALSEMAAMRQPQIMCKNLADLSVKIGLYLSRKARMEGAHEQNTGGIFIGHGNSTLWKELQAFLNRDMHLPCLDFNHSPAEAGTEEAKLADLLEETSLALLVLTTGDQQISGKNRCRSNLLHQAGLFQGKLGMSKAIILYEEGCEDFHEVRGITQFAFPKDNIKAVFKDIKQVLEREKLIAPQEELA